MNEEEFDLEDETIIDEAALDELDDDGPVVFKVSDAAEIGTVASEAVLPEGHKSGFVAIVGRPNVGKSTLMNNILQQKIAIVSPKAQTTRTKQLGIVTEPDYQAIFIDTPGIMKKALHRLDEVMLDAAVESLSDADVIVWLVDASYPPTEEDEGIAEMVSAARGHLILAMNKNDLVPPDDVVDRTAAYQALVPEDTPWFFFSADRNLGVDELYEAIIDGLPVGPRYYPADQITDTFMRDIAAEMIREQLLLQIREEVPHGTAVEITSFKEDDELIRINATIYVERDSHKRIIIGAGGKQIKKIGIDARKEIERLTGVQIHLELWVKVAPKWRRKEKMIKRFGYLES